MSRCRATSTPSPSPAPTPTPKPSQVLRYLDAPENAKQLEAWADLPPAEGEPPQQPSRRDTPHMSPISPHISPTFLPHISPISPPYLPHISTISPPYLARRRDASQPAGHHHHDKVPWNPPPRRGDNAPPSRPCTQRASLLRGHAGKGDTLTLPHPHPYPYPYRYRHPYRHPYRCP